MNDPPGSAPPRSPLGDGRRRIPPRSPLGDGRRRIPPRSPLGDGSRIPPRSPQGDGTPRGEVLLQNPCRYPEAGARRHRDWLEPLLADLAGTVSVTVRFVSDREMRRLNATFRNIDKATDVLSFPGGPEAEDDEKAPYLGDVVVSVPTARRQAAARGHGVERELRVLMLHGLLHCLGHDHETDDGAMERLERRLRRRWIDHA